MKATWRVGFQAYMMLTALAGAVTISGQIQNPMGGALSGLSTVRASNGGGVTSTMDGNYSLTNVPSGWTGVVVVERIEANGQYAAFTPNHRSYTNVTSSQSGQNFKILPNQPQTISGTVTNTSGQGVFEVLLVATTNGGAALTASNGTYNLGYHPQGPNWSGTVTPSKVGFAFTPSNRTYSAISTPQSGQNYLAGESAGGNLSLSKTADASSVTGGQTVAFTLTLTNTSAVATSNTVVWDALSPWLVCDTNTIGNGGAYEPGTRTITWPLGTFAAGSNVSLSFSVAVTSTVPSGLTITNIGSVSSTQTGTNHSNTVTLRTPLPETAIGKIAFMSDRDGDYDIYLMDAEGGEEINLTANAYDDMNPHFRFDGKRILYDSDRTGISRLYTIGADGTGEICISAGFTNSAQRGKWSWDGANIVFQSGAMGNGDIYMMSATGGPCTAVTSDAYDDEWPSFSPDGQWIVFQRMVGSMKTRLYRIRTNGTELTALTDGSNLDEMGYYSPDGQYIIFKRGTSNPDIYRINAADGSGATNLTSTGSDVEDAPVYSYEGTMIAFQSASGGPTTTEIILMNPDGTGRHAITTNSYKDWNPTFSPVGHLIVATAGENGSISPAGAVRVFHGRGTNFLIAASNWYHIASIQTNGGEAAGVGGSATNFVWNNICTDGTIQASFAANLAALGTPEWWLALHYPGSNDFDALELLDTDGEGHKAWEEYLAGTDPTNAASFLGLTQIVWQAEGAVVRWYSVSNRHYRLERATNLAAAAPFDYLVKTNIPATPPLNTETDTTAVGSGPWFYRVGLEK